MSSSAASNGTAIAVRDLGKVFQIYDRPADRLKQAFWRGRRKLYREFWALRNVSFDVSPGETLGIIGRNGAGKSTLLQMICGTLTPSEGSIEVRGRISTLLELGAGFNPEFTGRENVRLSATMQGLSGKQIDAIYDDIVAFADIGDFIDQPVKTYSSGMYVRLAFAVAAQVDPQILIVDEALAVGDVFFQQKCIRYMRENLAAATKILVTHDLHAVTTLAERVLVLEHGQAVFMGPPLEAIEFYTKTVQNETFRAASKAGTSHATTTTTAVSKDLPWAEVEHDDRSGAGEVRIERVAITDAHDAPLHQVQGRTTVAAHIEIHTSVPKRNIIIGYIINDRLGNAICGENTCSVADGLLELPRPGAYLVTMTFRWPEIAPGEYTITFGIGEGDHPLHHTIQCWAHNVVKLVAVSPTKVIHCLFNNPIERLEMTPVG